METIEAKFKIVTPMFISGADQTKAELRVPSIKGALRFWWRALNYKEDSKKLLENESAIFGSTDGQSKVKMRLKDLKTETREVGNRLEEGNNSVIGEGARYLGYGLMGAFGKNGGVLERPCIANDSEATLVISCSNEMVEKIMEPLKIFALLGNIGSRSRRGYGSICFTNIMIDGKEVFSIPKDSLALKDTINEILSQCKHNDLLKYSAFSLKTRIIIAKSGNNPLKVLDEIGKEMMRYRSWGHRGNVLGKPSEKNFKEDHDWSKNPNIFKEDFHPKRIVFGLPQNYSPYLGCEPHNDRNIKSSRRASPLFIHITQTGDGQYHGIISLFESEFLPDDFKIKAGNKIVEQVSEFSVLHEFMDRFNVDNLSVGGDKI